MIFDYRYFKISIISEKKKRIAEEFQFRTPSAVWLGPNAMYKANWNLYSFIKILLFKEYSQQLLYATTLLKSLQTLSRHVFLCFSCS